MSSQVLFLSSPHLFEATTPLDITRCCLYFYHTVTDSVCSHRSCQTRNTQLIRCAPFHRMLERQASVNSALPPPSPTPSQPPPPSPSPSAYDEARKQRLSAMLDTLPPELERRLSVHHGFKLHRYDTVSMANDERPVYGAQSSVVRMGFPETFVAQNAR